MQEIWKTVPNWTRYEASNLGRIRSVVCWQNSRPPKILKFHLTPNGYLTISFCMGGKRKTVFVHQIICLTFHGPKPTDKHEVAHADGIRTNNAADNLRWATKSENREDARRHGTLTFGSAAHFAKLEIEDVRVIREMARTKTPYKQISESFGICRTHISRIVHGKCWNHTT